MGKLYSVVLLCVLAFLCACCFAGVNCDSHHAPAPSVDCSTLIYSMADCLSFVTNGSKVTKPEGGCCSGLKTVLKTDAECLCEAFKSSAQLGVALNETKAAGLPAACKIKAPSVSKCGLSGLSGATSPALPPKSSAPSPISGAGGRAPISGLVPAPAPAGAPGALPTGTSGALAPTPAASAASTASISFVVFATMLAASYFSLQFIISY